MSLHQLAGDHRPGVAGADDQHPGPSRRKIAVAQVIVDPQHQTAGPDQHNVQPPADQPDAARQRDPAKGQGAPQHDRAQTDGADHHQHFVDAGVAPYPVVQPERVKDSQPHGDDQRQILPIQGKPVRRDIAVEPQPKRQQRNDGHNQRINRHQRGDQNIALDFRLRFCRHVLTVLYLLT